MNLILQSVPSVVALGLTVATASKCLRKNIGVTSAASGKSFLVADRTVRFYPERFEEAQENESISVVYSHPLDLIGPKPEDFAVYPDFTTLDGRQIVNIPVEAGTHFYGGGEISAGMCLNNAFFITWNQDYGYNSKTPNLYQSHPYVMGVRKDGTSFGVIADTTYPLRFSMTDNNLRIENWGKFDSSNSWEKVNDDYDFLSHPFSVTIFEGKNPIEVVKKLASLTGYMNLPPKWSIGYHQCRWSYYPDTEALRVAKTFREKNIPCDVIWFDIHYMKDYRIFTFDPTTFPDPKKLNDELHELGFHTVWYTLNIKDNKMIDPGVKQEEGYSVHDQCVAKNLAILKSKNSKEPSIGHVWPGACVFPDFTMKETDEWWQTLYKDFMNKGVDGVWNDMNEPAAFDSENKTLSLSSYHRGMGGGEHTKFHNIYGVLMVKSSREGILKANPTKRPFVLSRSSFLGGQRYAATWTGDNSSNWEHLKLSISMVINLGLSGQPFSGPDIGGFFDNASSALFSRWIGFGSLLPFSRGHTHEGSIAHEPWAFGEETEEISRISLNRRYKLLPHYYTLFHKASKTGVPIVCPSFFSDPLNQDLRKEDSSFLVGKDLLVIVNTSENGELIVNPAFEKSNKWHNLLLDSHEHPDLPLLKIREGSIIVTQQEQQYVSQIPLSEVELQLFICLDSNGNAKGKLYEDEGEGFGYQNGNFCMIRFNAQQKDNKVTLTVSHSGSYSIPLSWKLKMSLVNREDIGFTYDVNYQSVDII